MEKIKLLIIDDEESIVDSMSRLFQRRGYDVASAMNGDDAIKLYDSFRPDISLIDVHMIGAPEEGIRILQEIKKMNKDAICIMLTRITKEEIVARSKELGAYKYLLKPFKTEELYSLVKEAEQVIRGGGNG